MSQAGSAQLGTSFRNIDGEVVRCDKRSQRRQCSPALNRWLTQDVRYRIPQMQAGKLCRWLECLARPVERRVRASMSIFSQPLKIG